MSAFVQGVIDNRGPNNLRDQVRTLLLSSKNVDIEAAFVTRSGVQLLLPRLRDVISEGGVVRLLTGLYRYTSEPEALQLLLDIARNSSGRFRVRVSTHATFHKKLFIFRRPKTAQVLIGSANLSAEGLTSAGELAVLMSGSVSDSGIRKIQAGMDRDWGKHSKSLTPQLIARYSKGHERRRPKRVSDGGLKKVIGRAIEKGGAGPDETQSEKPVHRYWRDYISGYAVRKTVQAVYSETNWDRRGLDWYANVPQKASEGDGLLLIDHPDNRVFVAEVVEAVHLTQSTPGGRFVLAFRPIRSCRIRRISRAVAKDLKAAGLRQHVRRHVTSELSPKTWDAIRRFFRK